MAWWASSIISSPFQSTAGPMTGCNLAGLEVVQQFARVSIHSRPHDRLQQWKGLGMLTLRRFQSTAGPMTGCNGRPRRGAARDVVSIHSRPHDRLQPADSWVIDRRSSFNPQPAP